MHLEAEKFISSHIIFGEEKGAKQKKEKRKGKQNTARFETLLCLVDIGISANHTLLSLLALSLFSLL